MKTLLIIGLAILLITISVFAEAQSGAGFLKYPSSARHWALGGAGVASGHDASAMVLNPATLNEINFQHFGISGTGLGVMDASIIDVFGGYHLPTAGTIGLNVHMFTVKPFDVIMLDGTTESYGQNDMSISIGYAHHIMKGLEIGIAPKMISRKVADVSGSGFGADLGATYTTGQARAGLAVQNVGSSVTLGESTDKLPMIIAVGGNYEGVLGPLSKVNAMIDVGTESANGAFIKPGFEYVYNEMFMARIGYNTLNKSLTFGAGFDLKYVGFDIGAMSHRDLGQLYQFTVYSTLGK